MKKQQKATAPVPRSAVVVIVLDETGSMEMRLDETIVAYNTYIDGLRESDVDIYVQTLKFDQFAAEPTVRFLYEGFALLAREVPRLTREFYAPRGGTPLYDAIGQGISTAENIRHQKGADRVTLMIQTDGLENASREFSYERIKELIEQKKTAGWDIIFLAADLGQRGHMMAGSLGLSRGKTMSYAGSNSAEAFDAAAIMTRNFTSGVTGQSTEFSDEDRKKSGDTT